MFDNILLIRFSSLGDLVLTTPVYRELRKVLPNARLTLLTSEGFGRVLSNNPHLDKIIYHSRRESFQQLQAQIEELRSHRFDLIYDLHNSLRSRWIRWQLQLRTPHPQSWTIDKRTLARLALIHLHWNQLNQGLSQREQWLLPLQAFASTPLDGTTELFPNEKEQSKVQAWLMDRELHNSPFVAIGPSASFALKCWPLDYFAALVQKILDFGVQVVLVGGSNERETAELAERFPTTEMVFQGAGLFSPLESAALLSKALAVVSNDTSLIHLAEAMNTPALALFGPTVREFGYAPFLPQSQLLESRESLTCRPCSRTGKGNCRISQTQHCMTSLSVDDVWECLLPLLQTASKPSIELAF